MYFSLIALLVTLLTSAKAYTPCPILGPDYPSPSGLASDSTFQAIIRNITDTLTNATKQSSALHVNLRANETSYSIGIFDVNSTVLSFQHTADAAALAPESTKNVTADSMYRIGSVSKLLTVYTYLVEVGFAYWDRPITDFVPEMAAATVDCTSATDPLTCTDWCSITLGALASHLAGVARGHQPLPNTGLLGGIPVVNFGLPPSPAESLTLCNSTPCSRADALRAFLQEAPVALPFQTPIYSNGAYQLLGYALENITGRSFKDLIETDVFGALGMDTSSYAYPGNITTGVIPGTATSSGWNAPQGDAGAAGGVYSSQNDMVKLGQAMLNSTQLTAVEIRRWMKPLTHTAAWQASVGLAWEIARWEVDGRIIDVYAKQGDIGAYHARFWIIPDYNIGAVVLTAGSGGTEAQLALSDTILSLLVPGLEATAKAQAESNYAGTYSSSDSALNSTITLATEIGLPGLKITEFISNSSDVLTVLIPALYSIPNPDVRLYPTLITEKLDNGNKICKWHIVVTDPDRIYPYEQIRASHCVSWEMVDSTVYGAIGIDEVWIETDANGQAVNTQPKAFGVTLEKD